MRLEGLRPRVRSWDPWARWAVGAWLAVLLVVCGQALLRPRFRSLYPTYAAAGRDWLAGRTLYRDHWEPYEDQFRYSPLVAALLVPFHLLPEGPGAALWRLVNAGALLGGLGWWLRAAAPRAVSARARALLFLLVLPLALASLQNGQANPLMTGL